MKQTIFVSLLVLLASVSVSAQIGYQVALLDNATGEPRANERVTVTVRISNCDNITIFEGTQNVMTNDFGVISLSVGNSSTFDNVDWTKLPFFIEATVDNRLIGKSQLLSVPVAEYAKRTGCLTQELLCSKEWSYEGYSSIQKINFGNDGKYSKFFHRKEIHLTETGKYWIEGNMVFCQEDKNEDMYVYFYVHTQNALVTITFEGGLFKPS